MSSDTISRPRGRPAVDPQETQKRIHQATRCLLIEDGPNNFTMEAVAARAGIAKKTLYRFAPDREALVASLVSSWVDAALPNLTRPTEAPLKSLRDILVDFAKLALSEEAVGLFRVLVKYPELRAPLLPIYDRNGIQRARGLLAEWLDEQSSQGVLKLRLPADRTADLMLSAVVAEPLRQLSLGLPSTFSAQVVTARASEAVLCFVASD